MTHNELKWYIVSKIGSKISETKILRNKELHKTLKAELRTRDMDDILEQLHTLGFTLITKSGNEVKLEIVNTYYIELQVYEKPDIKNNVEHSKYINGCIINNKKRMALYYEQKRNEKNKYGLSKPYYRENTNYSSIW
jgi:hypothetical protein